MDAALTARATGFDASANPDLFRRQQLVGARLNHGFLCQLFFFERLVLREIARVGTQVPAIEFQNARGHAIQKRAIVSDGDKAAPEFQQQCFKPFDAFHVQMVGGLVQQQHIGRAHQGLRQGDPLGVAAGQGGDARLPVEFEPRQRFLHTLLPIPAVHQLDGILQFVQLALAACVLVNPLTHLGQAFTDRFEHGLLWMELRLLCHEGASQALLTMQAAIVREFLAGQNSQQRRLACAVAADQADPLLDFQRKVDMVQKCHMAVGQLGLL